MCTQMTKDEVVKQIPTFSFNGETYKLNFETYIGFENIMISWPNGNTPDALYEYCTKHQNAFISELLKISTLKAAMVKLQVMEREMYTSSCMQRDDWYASDELALFNSAINDLKKIAGEAVL
ncbi:hypothetical protein [Terasakiella sp.]|uniref:hypothetical protein n=1 Tax=Terasakiella sp. TaxID=2034861 RepID=UPI003AA84277